MFDLPPLCEDLQCTLLQDTTTFEMFSHQPQQMNCSGSPSCKAWVALAPTRYDPSISPQESCLYLWRHAVFAKGRCKPSSNNQRMPWIVSLELFHPSLNFSSPWWPFLFHEKDVDCDRRFRLEWLGGGPWRCLDWAYGCSKDAHLQWFLMLSFLILDAWN